MTAKERAALKAVELVENGMVLGLGTGSTATLIVREIGRRLGTGQLADIRGVPTSEAIEQTARESGVPVFSIEEAPTIDLTLDGADEVDPAWNLIKGAGGSLLREKIVAQNSRIEAIVVDETKLVDTLGTRLPLPVEVVPFGWSTHLHFLRSLGCTPVLRRTPDGTPFVTDEGNYTLDLDFRKGNTEGIVDPRRLYEDLRHRPGIVETGLFLGMTHILVIGRPDSAEILRAPAA